MKDKAEMDAKNKQALEEKLKLDKNRKYRSGEQPQLLVRARKCVDSSWKAFFTQTRPRLIRNGRQLHSIYPSS
jgi:hypothetical protein